MELLWIVILTETGIIALGIVVGLRLRNRQIISSGIEQIAEVDMDTPSSYDEQSTTRRSEHMRTITISDEDAAQVNAILMTHAEMQDHRTLESMQLLGRLKRDEPDAARDTIADLEGQIEDFEGDCDNLRRIAVLFN